MKKSLLSIIFVFISVLLLSSCMTPEPQVEYVPVDLDIEELIQPIIKERPEDVKLIDAPESLSDIMSNSVSFQFAYDNWRNYAIALENFYLNLENKTT